MRGRAGRDGRKSLKSIGFMKTKGLRHPSFALTIIHWTCILRSIKSNLPRGKPDSFRPSLCSESARHMAYFCKSPLLPTAWVSEPNPKGSQDGSFNRLSNQSRELADLAPPGLSWGATRFAAWGSSCDTQPSRSKSSPQTLGQGGGKV